MMKVKGRAALLLLTIGMLLFIPIVASADTVAWNTENYSVSTRTIKEDIESYSADGPPLPVSVSISQQVGNSTSEITASTMHVNASGDNRFWIDYNEDFESIASFTGTYNAALPYFNFTYNYSVDDHYTYNGYYRDDKQFTTATLLVIDLTDSTDLLNVEIDTGNGFYSVSTPFGHEIQVDLNLDTYIHLYDRVNIANGTGTLGYGMSVNTAVAPEPISSILFVTGGTFLAGRRYIKRKMTA